MEQDIKVEDPGIAPEVITIGDSDDDDSPNPPEYIYLSDQDPEDVPGVRLPSYLTVKYNIFTMS
jgi:hypothetical protein